MVDDSISPSSSQRKYLVYKNITWKENIIFVYLKLIVQMQG